MIDKKITKIVNLDIETNDYIEALAEKNNITFDHAIIMLCNINISNNSQNELIQKANKTLDELIRKYL